MKIKAFIFLTLSLLSNSVWGDCIDNDCEIDLDTKPYVDNEKQILGETGQQYVLHLKWFHQFQFAGYYAAVKMGFYHDEGLNVIIEPRNVDSTPADEVLSGRADFGISDSSLVLRKLKGDNLVVLAGIFQNSPLVLMSLANKNITSPLDIKGKRIMYQREIDDALIAAVFNEFDISEDDYQYIPHNFDDNALLNNQADAMSGYITDQPYTYKKLGHAINIINPINYGVDFYGDMLFTSEQLIESKPQVALSFREASIKGWEYALNNPAQVIDWILTDYDTTKDRAALAYEAQATRRVIRPKLVDIGNLNPGRFNRISEIYKEKGLAPTSSSLERFIYTDYLTNEPTYLLYLRVALVVISVGILAMLVVLTANYRLRKAVDLRTDELSQANNAIAATNERLRRLMGFVSHDLRNPLSTIYSLSQIINRRKPDEERMLEMFQVVGDSAKQGLELVKSILDTAALGTGKLELDIVPVNMPQLIAECLENFKTLAESRNITLNFDCNQSVFVLADGARIAQVMSNIVLNAVKYAVSDTTVNLEILVENSSVIFRCTNKHRELQDTDNMEGLYKSIGFGMEIVNEILELHRSEPKFENSNGIFRVEFRLPRTVEVKA